MSSRVDPDCPLCEDGMMFTHVNEAGFECFVPCTRCWPSEEDSRE